MGAEESISTAVVNRKIFVRIRGIYATALTQLLQEEGFLIADPSVKITERFGMEQSLFFAGVSIKDAEHKHGVYIKGGKAESLCVLSALKKRLAHLVIRECKVLHNIKDGRAKLAALFEQMEHEVLFPYSTKKELDKIREKVCCTMEDHHRFRIIDGELVDKVEEGAIQLKKELEKKILSSFKKGSLVEILHIRPEGEVFKMKEAEVLHFEDGALSLRRKMRGGGSYDGLNIKKEEGDWCITYAREGDWVVKHTYFSEDGRVKGEFYNINTGVELYPAQLRYIDLHIDIVKMPSGRVEVLDEQKLQKSLKEGLITPSLFDEAERVKERVVEDVKD